MAQEQEHRYPNVCVPQTPLVRKAGQPQDKDTHSLGRVCLSMPACLLSQVPHTGVLQAFPLPPPPPDRRSQCDNQFSRISGGKDSEKTGRKGKVTKALARPGWAELSRRDCASPPRVPLLRL